MSIPKTSSLSPLKAINQLLKLFYNALSFIISAIRAALGGKERAAYVDIKLTSESGGISQPVLVSNQFRNLGIITTDSHGLGSGLFHVVSGKTFNFQAVYSGTMVYEKSIAIISGIK